MLKVAGEDENMGHLSIIAKIDGSPSHLHRFHCHPLSKGPLLVKAALNVFGSKNGNVPYVPEDTFELRRLREDYESFVEDFKVSDKKDADAMAFEEGYGALLSVISHSYFDTYNNAVQAFAPYEGYCAEQYAMWKKVDYFNYRIKWYAETAPTVREKVLSEDFWNVSFSAKEMVKGLVHRLASLTQPSVSPETLKQVEVDLGIDDIPLNKDVEKFYLQLEESLERHLVESVKEPITN
ncbi:hypothetical protein [Fervidibacillus albus]|uniref:Uncharacterized protein n=1 Tax=Fervidibacillus albus TaxID=2980026 RepID=A0A9E8LUR4_9BACI|nr:hypothetical protein [Fervidibacillus albus]WAA09174.1 hypothetical protein OE104_11355 [Fervidibacillus albus]